LPQLVECLGSLHLCDSIGGATGGTNDPGFNIMAVESTPEVPIISRPVAVNIRGLAGKSVAGVDLRNLHARVEVLFCVQIRDCLLFYEHEGPFCKVANLTKGQCSRPMTPEEPFQFNRTLKIPAHIIRGSYFVTVDVRDQKRDSRFVCYEVSSVIVHSDSMLKEIYDYRDAVVAFIVAASASRTLGRLFPECSFGVLPQISGFLVIGIVVGPYVANLVSKFHVYLIGRAINRLSLSLIAGAAGIEIFYPELQRLLRPLMLQVALISVVTIVVCAVGLLMLFNLDVVALPMLNMQSSFVARVAIAMLAGTLMTARSPASAIAVIKEMKCSHIAPSKVILGVTVLGDIIVLMLFALSTNFARVATEGGTFGPSVLLGVSAEILASCLLGVLAGQALPCCVPYETPSGDKEHGGQHKRKSTAEHLKMLRGAALLAILLGVYIASERAEDWSSGSVRLEPLLACTVASCVAGHDVGRRRQMLESIEWWTPKILLPFFTLAGASLQLHGLAEVFPAALALVALRTMSVAIGSIAAGWLSVRLYPDVGITTTTVRCLWSTLLAQAGVTLGLVIEVQAQFGNWASTFGTLVIGVVVLNQLLGPVLCRIGLGKIVAAEPDCPQDEYADVPVAEPPDGSPRLPGQSIWPKTSDNKSLSVDSDRFSSPLRSYSKLEI